MTKFKVGIVGCGVISVAHIKAWRKTESCRVAGVFDINKEMQSKRAKQFQIEKCYESIEALIEDCDVVDVCTPPQTHAEIAFKAISAGKHVVMEKPMVTDVRDWDAIEREVKINSTTITMIHNLKFSHSVQQAKKWIDQGRVGEVFSLKRQFLTSPEADRMLVGNTHWSHKLPGGRWFETLPHELYLFHFLVGPLKLEHVLALHTQQVPSRTTVDHVLITMQDEKCIATVEYSANCLMNERMLYIYGSKGSITLDLLSDYIFLSAKRDAKWKRAVGLSAIRATKALLRAIPDRSSYLIRQGRGETPHANIIKAFDNYLLGRGPIPTPVEEIDYVVRNCDLIGREIERQIQQSSGAAC